jgi:hypothetical protein
LIILEGINDIGYGATFVGNNLIAAYKQMISAAHAAGIYVYGATLLPMKGSSYYSTAHETERRTVNEWIRNSGYFDGVIDFDRALRNPADTLSLLPEADTGDHLHPNETGHQLMAEAVDLNYFTYRDSLIISDHTITKFYEPECAPVGGNWNIADDTQASNGKYVTVKSGIESLYQAPSGTEDFITIPFSIDTVRNYFVLGRLNCPTYDDDSFWIKMDDGSFQMYNGLVTSGWEWKNFNEIELTKGSHTLTIAYREDGAKLDKICITNSDSYPMGMGDEAENLCTPTGFENSPKSPDRFKLGQNHPNPFNPKTKIAYQLPEKSFVRLAVYNMNGQLTKTLISREQPAGYYNTEWDASNVSTGLYVYRIDAGSFHDVKKCIFIK